MSVPVEYTCRGCSLLCDDLQVTCDSAGEWDSPQACERGRDWLNRPEFVAPAEGFSLSALLSECLTESRNPLVCGLQGLTLEWEAELISWAERRRGYVSLGLPAEQWNSLPRYGGAGCTLGEVRHRADLLLAGECDLFTRWPRFRERILAPGGRFLSQDSARRLLYLGPPLPAEAAAQYDECLFVNDGELTEALLILRRECTGSRPFGGEYRTRLSTTQLASLQRFAAALRAAAYPVLFTGSTAQPGDWALLVRDMLQSGGRLHRISIPAELPTGSPTETLLALSGFPDTVRFRETGIEHDPVAFQPERLLAHRRIDGVLFAAGGVVSARWESFLRQVPPEIPVVLLVEADVCLPNADWPEQTIIHRLPIPGRTATGTCLRPDAVPLPLRRLP